MWLAIRADRHVEQVGPGISTRDTIRLATNAHRRQRIPAAIDHGLVRQRRILCAPAAAEAHQQRIAAIDATASAGRQRGNARLAAIVAP
ncbi:hypothetical protein [Cupriavidus sp. D39]|uniref:hypothetical protein n=1 Tax=Cupriavidus sp. D39 TaxID=2997877 RepID=UPI00226DA44C|nr:hypothetical protein [Cupriavidus sp. D39]MCY0856159.1 hypothetical protein [Cupriavidus sp. D39]